MQWDQSNCLSAFSKVGTVINWTSSCLQRGMHCLKCAISGMWLHCLTLWIRWDVIALLGVVQRVGCDIGQVHACLKLCKTWDVIALLQVVQRWMWLYIAWKRLVRADIECSICSLLFGTLEKLSPHCEVWWMSHDSWMARWDVILLLEVVKAGMW